MVQRVYFSYDLDGDADRARTVREHLEAVGAYEAVGIVDPAEWKKHRDGTTADAEAWIADRIGDTSVTAVLIGNDTANDELVHLEIEESWNQGNGIVGIYVHNIEDDDGRQDLIDGNPLDLWRTELADQQLFSDVYETYYWWGDDGYEHVGDWVDDAADRASRLHSESETL